MNEIKTQLIKGYFASFAEKAKNELEARQLAHGTFDIPNDGSVAPQARGQGVKHFDRARKLVQSYGVTIFNKTINGVLGNYDWNLDNAQVDNLLNDINLSAMLKECATDLITKGIAGLALGTSENTVKPYVLSGFISNVSSNEDVLENVGIFQGFINDSGKLTAKLFKDTEIQKWEDLKDYEDLAKKGARIIPLEYSPIAFTVTKGLDDTYTHIGEMEQLAPILKELLSLDMRIHRASTAYIPRMTVKGQANNSDVQDNTADSVIRVGDGGEVKYVSPNDFDILLKEREDKLKQLTDIAAMQFRVSGADMPSTEALELLNSEFARKCKEYADLLSELFTKTLKALFEAVGISNADDFSFVVTPGFTYTNYGEIEKLKNLLEAGLIPVEIFVTKLASQMPEIEPYREQMILDYKNRQSRINTGNDILSSLTS